MRIMIIVVRSVRQLNKGDQDKIISDHQALSSLLRLFKAFDDEFNKSVAATLQTASKNAETNSPDDAPHPAKYDAWEMHHQHQLIVKKDQILIHQRNLSVMLDEFGFCVERKGSHIENGGTGVFVTKGFIPEGRVVALYPGVVYEPFEPILFQSISNPFIFRCVDGILIDGNDKALSKVLYKSCCERDKVGPYFTADMTWLTDAPLCPLSVGQYVNNQSKEFPANVAYQELNIPHDFPLKLKKYIPNVNYHMNVQSHEASHRMMRTVALVSTRGIEEGEELYSTYFTVVQ